MIKVLDFGLAKVKSEGAVDGGLTHEGQLLGTPEYVAPGTDQRRPPRRHPRRHLQPGVHALLPVDRRPAIPGDQSLRALASAPLDGRPAAEPGAARRAGRAGGAGRQDDGEGTRAAVPDAKGCGPGAIAVLQEGRLVGIMPAASAVGELSEPSWEKEGRAHSRIDAAPLQVTPQAPSLRVASPTETSSATHPVEPVWAGLIKFREIEPPKEALPASVRSGWRMRPALVAAVLTFTGLIVAGAYHSGPIRQPVPAQEAARCRDQDRHDLGR